MAPTYEPRAKRRKLDATESGPKPTIESARDLHYLLQFKQSSSPDVKNDIQNLKEFLTDINKSETGADHANKLQILKEYCDSQNSGDKQVTCFPDLISTWSFAAQSNNDSILSAVPAVLALFLKTISTRIEFREFGLSLCRTLLEKDQLRLFDRGLTSVRSKEFLISPCLRLLTEIVSFDGGAVANSLYSRRDTVFKRLDVLLDHGTTSKYDNEELRRKPTVRRNAQRYVLANLKFQSSAIKSDLIAEGKILRRTLQGVNRDGSDIISDLLQSVRKDILEDTALSRKSKTRFFNAANLASLASLYSIADQIRPSETEGISNDTNTTALPTETLENRKSVRSQIHNLLLAVCTRQEDGILLSESGWYSLGSDPEVPIGQDEDNSVTLGLDSPLYFDYYLHKVPVKNGTLSTLIEGLRPAVDTLQAALVLKIFEAAPELVADYFSKKDKFTSEPKAEPIWLGEAAFLFSVIELPVPVYCGWDTKLPAMPPPVSIMIESILPRQLDRLILTRCFNLNDEVITLFAARVMIVAFKKLQRILALLCTATHEWNLWEQASNKLKKAFSQRCPQIKPIIQALQRAPKGDLRLYDALVDLVATYFRVLPNIALKDRFDVSTALIEVINRLDIEANDERVRCKLVEQISNLVFVAEISPLTNWWNKSGSELSLFCRLLRITASSSANTEFKTVKATLRAVLIKNGILLNEPTAFDALLASLYPSNKWTPSPAIYAFIDNCVGRVVRQPVHYLDLTILSFGEDAEISSSGTLVTCITEQWPFLANNGDLDVQKNVAEWIARFLSTPGLGDEVAIQSKIGKIVENMIETAQGMSRSILEMAFKKQSKQPIKLGPLEVPVEPQTSGDIEVEVFKDKRKELVLEDMFGLPLRSPDSLQGLNRWENADIESLVPSGQLSHLFQCVASAEEETRRQAYLTLRQLMAIFKASSYIERGPMYLLLGEVCETVQERGFAITTPSIVAELAVQVGMILADPAHNMYGKINKFLNNAPSWDAQKIILYWIDRILLKEPEDDDGHYVEVDWLLRLLANGLRTSADMELYRKSNIFERVLSLHCSPQLSINFRHRIMQVVYRAVQVGGSMTLVTRAGILSWIETQTPSSTKDIDMLEALKTAIERSSCPAEVKAWKTRLPKS